MLVTCIALAAAGLLVTALGGFLMIRNHGRTRALSAEEVGEDIVKRHTRDRPSWEPVAEAAAFKGVGGGRSVEASRSFAEVKADWREGRRDRAAPPLMILFGITALLVFGSLALLVGLESKLAGAVMLAAVILSLGRMLVDFAKA